MMHIQQAQTSTQYEDHEEDHTKTTQLLNKEDPNVCKGNSSLDEFE